MVGVTLLGNDNSYVHLTSIMTLIVNTIYHTIKGENKHLPNPKVQPTDKGLFSRLYLIRDRAQNCSYGFHLNPLLPPVYRFSTLTDRVSNSDETPSKFVLLGSGLEGFEEETRSELASCNNNTTNSETGLDDDCAIHLSSFIAVPNYDRAEDIVSFKLTWSSSHLSATWSMEVEQNESLPEKPSTSTVDERYKKYSILERTDENKELDENPDSRSERLDAKEDPTENIRSTSNPFGELASSTSKLPQSSPSATESPMDRTLSIFQWSRVSPLAKWELTASLITSLNSSSSSVTLVAEFIMETSPEERIQGSKGQLLFRDYYGRKWEAVVLCSVGMMVDVIDEVLLQVVGEEKGESIVKRGVS
jgi:hypothetical protein